MRRKHLTLAVLAIVFALWTSIATGAQVPRAAAPGVPKTAISEVKEIIQGVEISDPYRWLEEQNSPQTREWIDEQNAYTDSVIAKLPGRDALREKVSALLKIENMNIPTLRNGRYFFTRRLADQDQAMLYVRQGLNGKDELLVDPLALSPQHTITVNLNSVSRDGALIVYSLRSGGEDEVTPHLFDVNARKELADKFPRARYSGLVILPDKSGLYLTRQTPEGPRVYFHKIGSGDADTEVFGKGYGPEKIINSSLSEDGHYLIINVSYGSAATKNEVYFQDLGAKGAIVPVVNDVTAAFATGGGESGPNVAGDKLYLRTNWNAPKWRVLEVDLKNPARDHWREVIPEGENAIDSLSLAGGKLAVAVTENVINHVRLYDINGKLLREINPPSLGNLSALRGTWDSNEAFFTFNSFHIPPTIYRYDVAAGKQAVWFQSPLPIPTDRYEVKQVWYSSKDGTKIPMFVAHAKGLKLDGSHPALLTGYGGFNLNSNPAFSPFAAAWMESGGVWALANLRGGGEYGEAWHHAGMLDKKQNVFDDFIAAGEWLVKNKYTSPEHLAIRGRSNGGLRVGADI